MGPVPNGIDRGFRFDARYERTLFEDITGQAYHVLGMGWGTGRPQVHLRRLELHEGALFYEGGVRTFEMTPGRTLGMAVSKGLFCTGRFYQGHEPCPGREVLEGFSQCRECLVQDIPDPGCIFEPHCRSGTCGAFFCQVPHVVYAAVYGKRVKVGMTQAARIRERGMEQGADVILPLVKVADRYSARQLEEWFSSRYRIPQALPSKVVLGNMSTGTDTEAAKKIASGLLERLRKEQQVMTDMLKGRGIRVEVMPREIEGVPMVLGPYPGPPVLGTVPRKLSGDIIRGVVVMSKGKWCVTNGEGLAAFKMPDLVGRLVLSDDAL